jgi:hypothetical protein
MGVTADTGEQASAIVVVASHQLAVVVRLIDYLLVSCSCLKSRQLRQQQQQKQARTYEGGTCFMILTVAFRNRL